MDDTKHGALKTCKQRADEAEENAAESKSDEAAKKAAKHDRTEKVFFLVAR